MNPEQLHNAARKELADQARTLGIAGHAAMRKEDLVRAISRALKKKEKEREKMKAAHQKAMQDPTVQAAHVKERQARKEFRDAMHAALLKADPSLQPVLDKMKTGEKGGHDQD